jgi:hypothetical protein
MDLLPRPILVFLVLAAGIAFILMVQKPHTVCESQLTVLQEAQAGQLFPRQIEGGSIRPAIYPRLIENCKLGNSPGACYELMVLLRKLTRDLNGSPRECLVPFGEVIEIKRALFEGTRLIIQIAWGDKPPERSAKFNWLESSDVALFCKLKETMTAMYGADGWDQFRLTTYKKLPGEPQEIKDGVCTNCDTIRMADSALTAEDIWVRSLFSVRCESFR